MTDIEVVRIFHRIAEACGDAEADNVFLGCCTVIGDIIAGMSVESRSEMKILAMRAIESYLEAYDAKKKFDNEDVGA